MPLSQISVSIDKPKDIESSSKKARIIKWKGQEMIRTHSIRAAVSEILNMFNSAPIIKVGIVGDTGTGKSELARTIGHLAHKIQEENKKFPMTFREFGEEQYYDFDGTIQALEPANYILYFHDLSFLVQQKAIQKIKHAITTIRHLKPGFEAKILLIVDYHYTLALDPYLRQSDFKFFTSLGSSEMKNMLDITGTKHMTKLKEFKQIFVEQRSFQRATFRFANSKSFVYNYKNPFVIVLFWNETYPRFVAFPLRQWIDPICHVCTSGLRGLQYNKIDVSQFVKTGRDECGERVFDLAGKLILLRNGVNVFARSTVSAEKYIMRALDKKQFTLEELAVAMNYKLTKANIRPKLAKLLEEDIKQETLELIPNEVNNAI